MNAPNPMTPEMQQAIREALATGKPLPPGVVAVQPGQTPPPGAIPIPMGNPMGGARGPGQPPVTREKTNPIPEGDEGIELVRRYADCPIPMEANKINHMLQSIIKTPPTDDTHVEETIARGLAAAMRATRYCTQNVKTRIAGSFVDDPQLKELHDKIQEEQKTMDSLNTQMNECVLRGNALLTERWNKAVRAFGLSPEKYSYRVNEGAGTIEQVDLNCAECKGSTIIRKARQDVAESLVRTDSASETGAK
jgi:hypothetical protein